MTDSPLTDTQLDDDRAIQILSNEGAQCGVCGDQPGDRICPDCERCRGWYVAALRKAGWAPQDEHDALVAEVHRLRAQIAAVTDLCDAAEKQATRWEQPLPVPEWVAAVRSAINPPAARPAPTA